MFQNGSHEQGVFVLCVRSAEDSEVCIDYSRQYLNIGFLWSIRGHLEVV